MFNFSESQKRKGNLICGIYNRLIFTDRMFEIVIGIHLVQNRCQWCVFVLEFMWLRIGVSGVCLCWNSCG
jgi:hypothetical protein